MKNRSSILILVGLSVVLISVGVYYIGNWWEKYQRPWAFNDSEPVLVGSWQGSFTDPDGVKKDLQIEIETPEIKRKTRVGRGRVKSSDKKRYFEGTAVVNSRLGKEIYEIHGWVEKEDYHRITLRFSREEPPTILPNFYVNLTENNTWQANEMKVTLTFAYQKTKEGTFSNSSDPRFDKKVTLTLQRTN